MPEQLREPGHQRPIAWLDYILASEDPIDKALAQENLKLSWAHGEYSRWMLSQRTFSPAMLEKIEEQHVANDALINRIYNRAQELVAAGCKPADEATAEAYHALRMSISANIPSEHDEIYRV